MTTLSAFTKTEDEIIKTINTFVYGDSDAQTEWARMIADAMLNKMAHRLAEFLSHGKGFNDGSKKAFCALLDVKPVLTQKGIDSLIAQHCGIELHTFLLQRQLHVAESTEMRKAKNLESSYGNGNELLAWVQGLFEDGYSKLLSKNRKTYLVNEAGNGYYLQTAPIKEYALALFAVKTLQCQLA